MCVVTFHHFLNPQKFPPLESIFNGMSLLQNYFLPIVVVVFSLLPSAPHPGMAMVAGGEEDRAVNGNFAVPREVTQGPPPCRKHLFFTIIKLGHLSTKVITEWQLYGSLFYVFKRLFLMCLNRFLTLDTAKFREVLMTALEEKNH